MTVEIPEWVAAAAHVNAYWLPAAADLDSITVAEFTAGVDLTCFMPEMFDGITREQEKGEQTRACLRSSFEVLGKVKDSIADASYTTLPQEVDTHAANKVATALKYGEVGVVVIRRGKPADEPIEAGDRYDAIRAEAGVQNKPTKGADEYAPIVNTSSFSTRGAMVEGVVAA